MKYEIELNDIWLAMCDERVNVEVMFNDDRDMGMLVTCRLRPYKNSVNDGHMILAGGTTPEEAIAYAYLAIVEGVWVPLDWRARARSIGVQRHITVTETPKSPRFDPKMAREALASRFMNDHTGHSTNGAHKPPQEQPEQTGTNKPRAGK